MKKVQRNGQTGHGGTDTLTTLDEAVLDIIGRESVQVKGLGIHHDTPQLGTDVSKSEARNPICFPGNTKQLNLNEIFAVNLTC